jgi:NTP pyrophosphatase (non-canonical NTP hydrolase)
MDEEEKFSLLDQAIRKWGWGLQADMAIEECSELIQAICKRKRGYQNEDNLIEEIADVCIMMDQMKLMFGIDKVEAVIDKKLNLLKERLEKD